MAALIISAQRVGWRLTGPTCAVDDLGREWDLLFYSTACVADQIQHSARRASGVRALSLQDRSGWRDTIFWRPILEAMFCEWEPGWGKHQQSALRGLVTGTHWTQSRLHDQDAAVDSLCLDRVRGSAGHAAPPLLPVQCSRGMAS